MATIDYKQLATPEANLIELLAAQNQDGTYSAKLMGSEPFAVLAAKTIYNAYNDIEDNMAADVEGPASSTDNAVARFNGTTGKLLQNSLVTIDDSGGVFVPESLNITNIGLITGIFFSSSSQQRGQIIYTGGAIRFLSGVTTNGLIVGSSTSQLQFNNSGLATLTGNLTVSGVTTSAGISNSGALTFTAAIGQVAGSIAKNATYGLTYHGVTGSSNDNTMLNASGAVVLSNPAGTTNATLTGNLTVSGGQALISHSGSYANIYFAVTGSSYSEIRAFSSTGEFRTNSGPSAGWGGFLTWQTDASEKMRLTNSGNFLIGTTTDSSNGKLQLATHTTSAGGIGFGTDTSLYRSQTGMLALDGLTGSLSQLDLRVGGVQKAFVAWNGGDFYLGAVVGTTVIRSSNTTALTLDSSQNATFAGDVGLSGNEKYLNLFSTYVVGSNSRARLRAVGSGGGSGYGGSFTVDTRTSGNTFITALTIDDAQNAAFAGQITASGISHKLGSGGTGAANALLTIDGSSASSYGPYIVLQRNSTNKWQFGTYSGINGGTSDDFLLYNPTAANEALKIAAATSNATFAGAIAIGNTVNTVSPTSPNRTITMVIGGTTYYIHAKTTND